MTSIPPTLSRSYQLTAKGATDTPPRYEQLTRLVFSQYQAARRATNPLPIDTLEIRFPAEVRLGLYRDDAGQIQTYPDHVETITGPAQATVTGTPNGLNRLTQSINRHGMRYKTR